MAAKPAAKKKPAAKSNPKPAAEREAEAQKDKPEQEPKTSQPEVQLRHGDKGQVSTAAPAGGLAVQESVARAHAERTGGGTVREGELQAQLDEHNART